MEKELKILSQYGPGGRNCVCCGPGPSQRKKHDRAIKRRQRALVKKDIRKQLTDAT